MSVFSANGVRLTTGRCFNEQVLIGMPASSCRILVPKTECEVQIISKEVWDKVISEFPAEHPDIEAGILGVIADKALKRIGYEGGSEDPEVVLSRSALFRGTKPEFLYRLRKRLKNRVYNVGEHIAHRGTEAQCMYFILGGCAAYDPSGQNGSETKMVRSGGFWGEAMLLGITGFVPSTLVASEQCIVQVLYTQDLGEVLEDFPKEQAIYEILCEENKGISGSRLHKKLQTTPAFVNGNPKFTQALCWQAEDAFFGPGEVIMNKGDKCRIGETSFFVLLAGQVVVEGDVGVVICSLPTGTTFGESGALGLTSLRTARIRAWNDGPIHCARILGEDCLDAAQAYPPEIRRLDTHFLGHEKMNRERQETRVKWVKEIAQPALASSGLLRGLSPELLLEIAAQLYEKNFAPGVAIASAGEPASSMLILLEGAEAEVEARDRSRAGRLVAGGSFGEVSALGLFPTRTATLRALGPSQALGGCRVLEVTAKALLSVFEGPNAGRARHVWRMLVRGRKEQVARGMPMSVVPSLKVPSSDVASRAIALQAERIDVAARELLHLLPESDPCGAHLCVIVAGRATLEMQPSGREVLSLPQGSLVPEALCASFGADLRAVTAMEVYRIRQTDVVCAEKAVPASQDWLYRLRLQERDIMNHIKVRLMSARGVDDGVIPQSADQTIDQWRLHRAHKVTRAEKLRLDRFIGSKSLPALPVSRGGMRAATANGRMRATTPGGMRAVTPGGRRLATA